MLLNDPDEWRDADENTMAVATFTIFVIDALTFSGTLACPTRVPDTDTVKVIDGAAVVAPVGNVEKLNVPIPEEPGASVARDGSVSLLKTTVRLVES